MWSLDLSCWLAAHATTLPSQFHSHTSIPHVYPTFLQVITQDELKSNPAARQALSAALSTPNPAAISSSGNTPIFVAIGITDPEVAAFLTQATAQLPTVLFWNSDADLSASSRVDGYAPATAGPFAKLLAQNVGFSREAKAAEVMKTLEVLWGRNTSGAVVWQLMLFACCMFSGGENKLGAVKRRRRLEF